MVTFVWELSSLEANGIITGFIILYGPRSADDGSNTSGFVAEHSRKFGPDDRKGVIQGKYEWYCRHN